MPKPVVPDGMLEAAWANVKHAIAESGVGRANFSHLEATRIALEAALQWQEDNQLCKGK